MAKIEIIGNVGKDAELKFIKGSKGDFAVASFSMCETPRDFKNGEWHIGEGIWWNIKTTGTLAETCADFVTKGLRVIVQGEVREYSYEKNGETKKGWEVRAKTVGIIPSLKKVDTGGDDFSWN